MPLADHKVLSSTSLEGGLEDYCLIKPPATLIEPEWSMRAEHHSEGELDLIPLQVEKKKSFSIQIVNSC